MRKCNPSPAGDAPAAAAAAGDCDYCDAMRRPGKWVANPGDGKRAPGDFGPNKGELWFIGLIIAMVL